MTTDLGKLLKESLKGKDPTDFLLVGKNNKKDYMISHISLINPSVKKRFYDTYENSSNFLAYIFGNIDSAFINIIEDYYVNDDISKMIYKLNSYIGKYNDIYDIRTKENLIVKIENIAVIVSKHMNVLYRLYDHDIKTKIIKCIHNSYNKFLSLGNSNTPEYERIISYLITGFSDGL